MILSEIQEKDLIQLYWDIYNYAFYLEHETYQPYVQIKEFAKRLRNIIGDDEKINSLKI